jgi:hypothetical protein
VGSEVQAHEVEIGCLQAALDRGNLSPAERMLVVQRLYQQGGWLIFYTYRYHRKQLWLLPQ